MTTTTFASFDLPCSADVMSCLSSSAPSHPGPPPASVASDSINSLSSAGPVAASSAATSVSLAGFYTLGALAPTAFPYTTPATISPTGSVAPAPSHQSSPALTIISSILQSPSPSPKSPSQIGYVVTIHSTTLSIRVVPITETSTDDSASLFVVFGSTTKELGETVTIQGVPIAVSTRNDHTNVLVGSTILTNPFVVSAGAATTNAPNGQTLTQDLQGDHMSSEKTMVADSTTSKVAQSTIEPVAIATTSGHTIIIVGDTTSTLNSPPSTTAQSLPLITLGSKTYTPNSNSDYVIAGQTLEPGGSPIIISGNPVSLIPQGTAVVVGGSTTLAETVGLGDIIMSGFDGTSQSTSSVPTSILGGTNSTSLPTFTSSGKREAAPLLSIWVGTAVLSTLVAFVYT